MGPDALLWRVLVDCLLFEDERKVSVPIDDLSLSERMHRMLEPDQIKRLRKPLPDIQHIIESLQQRYNGVTAHTFSIGSTSHLMVVSVDYKKVRALRDRMDQLRGPPRGNRRRPPPRRFSPTRSPSPSRHQPPYRDHGMYPPPPGAHRGPPLHHRIPGPPGMHPPMGMPPPRGMGPPMVPPPMNMGIPPPGGRRPGSPRGGIPPPPDDDISSLLNTKSMAERQEEEDGSELAELITKPTSMASAKRKEMQVGSQVIQYCQFHTKEACLRHSNGRICRKVHFRKILLPHTDESLGDCSYLDTCRHMKTCKHVHYTIDYSDAVEAKQAKLKHEKQRNAPMLQPAQWFNTDVRSFDPNVLGHFDVIMTDPPWDIHMDLPYGTMTDDEMRDMSHLMKTVQTDGVIFLWITGRAMELARELLICWGYKLVDELIWVKTNQLQRIIRTGRTGHWLNHSKEHCLIGVKGSPQNNTNIDCDVLLAEVRETSRKPDEIYSLIERLHPGGRKLEIFGRQHNLRCGWTTLGNQLPKTRIVEQDMIDRYNARYQDNQYVPPTEAELPPEIAEYDRKYYSKSSASKKDNEKAVKDGT